MKSYSYLNDSTGLTAAALRAGKTPANKPIRVRTVTVNSIIPIERIGLPRNCIAPLLVSRRPVAATIPHERIRPNDPPSRERKKI